MSPGYHFLRVQGTCWCIDAVRMVYYVVEFKTIILTLNKFSFINLTKFDYH